MPATRRTSCTRSPAPPSKLNANGSCWGRTMPLTKAQIEQQQKEAEELLFSGPQTLGFAKGLFFGHFNAPLLFPYPQLPAKEQAVADAAVAEVQRYCDDHIDAPAIDRSADIPRAVIDGL